jgi:rhomboid family GlyGly-CTERM serine protease
MNKIQYLGLPLFVLLPCVIFYALGTTASEFLRYDNLLISSGQWWRLITAHWIHLNAAHLAMNMVGLMILWWLCKVPFVLWKEIALLLYLALVTGLGLHFFYDVYLYVGFSGVLHGVMMIWPMLSQYYEKNIALFFALIVVVKVLWEQSPWYSDEWVSSLINGTVMVDAHLLGVVAALPIVIFLWFYAAKKDTKKRQEHQ